MKALSADTSAAAVSQSLSDLTDGGKPRFRETAKFVYPLTLIEPPILTSIKVY